MACQHVGDRPHILDRRGHVRLSCGQGQQGQVVTTWPRTGQFATMVRDAQTVKREPFLGQSRLDFFVGNTYLEVKTPLVGINVTMGKHIVTKKGVESPSFERLVRHIQELAQSLDEGKKAILLVCFIYDNPRFSPPRRP